MKVMIETDNPQPHGSAYLRAGAPNQCFLPSCHKPFEQTCVHGHDGHYYCSQECASQANEMGLAQVLELRRQRRA